MFGFTYNLTNTNTITISKTTANTPKVIDNLKRQGYIVETKF
jgi:hypothetical protein